MSVGVGTTLTSGLGQGHTAMIIGPSRMYRAAAPLVVVTGGGGGSLPLAPGEIHNFYKVVSNDQYLIPHELYKIREKFVFITVTMNDKTFKQSIHIQIPDEQIVLRSVDAQDDIPTGTADVIPPSATSTHQPIDIAANPISQIVEARPINKSDEEDK